MSYIVCEHDGNDVQDCSPLTCPGGEHVLHNTEFSDGRAGTLLQMIINLDMASPPTDKRVDMPRVPEGVTWHNSIGWVDPDGSASQHNVAIQDYWRHRRGVEYGIAGYKMLASNDGWWVTGEECREALEVWESMGRNEQECQPEMVRRFVRLLRAGAVHDGFRTW